MRSTEIGSLVVTVIGCRVDEPSFSSALLLAFVYAMMQIISEHAQNRHTKVEGRERGGGK